MSLAAPIRKGELEAAEKVLAALGALFAAGWFGKVLLALIGLGQHKDDTAFSVLQGQITLLQGRVSELENQGAQERAAHTSEVADLRRQLAEANGERERLNLLTVHQAGRIVELEGERAAYALNDPLVRDAARAVSQHRQGAE